MLILADLFLVLFNVRKLIHISLGTSKDLNSDKIKDKNCKSN